MKNAVSLLTLALIISFTSSAFAQDAAKGKSLYASCIQCHGEKGEGSAEKKAPKLSGQYDWYVVKQISDIKSGVRTNQPSLPFVKGLSQQDMLDLAAYIMTL